MKEIKVGDSCFTGDFVVIAGPCAIESEDQLRQTVQAIRKNTDILRAGAYKPRTSPDSFQGLKEEGLKILKKVATEFDIPTVTEILDPRDLEVVLDHTDMLQIGSRNMANFELLKEVGKTDKPILFKRGFGATIDEWIASSKYILSGRNDKIIFCERGIRTFETKMRFTLDLAGAIYLKQNYDFPVIIDPSHATGNPKLIPPLVKATKAAGLDGVMVEVHINPSEAKVDADQALTPDEFNLLFV